MSTCTYRESKTGCVGEVIYISIVNSEHRRRLSALTAPEDEKKTLAWRRREQQLMPKFNYIFKHLIRYSTYRCATHVTHVCIHVYVSMHYNYVHAGMYSGTV